MIHKRAVNISWFVISAFSVVLLFLLCSSYSEILIRLGTYLVVQDRPVNSDFIYLLGGNYEVRAPFAAYIYRKGWAPRIVIARERDVPGTAGPNLTDVTIKILMSSGVPKEAVSQLLTPRGVTSTGDEAHALLSYLNSHSASRILIITSDYHTRRARLAFSRALGDRSRLVIIPAHEKWFQQTWWRHPYSRNSILTEYEKLLYYSLTFWG